MTTIPRLRRNMFLIRELAPEAIYGIWLRDLKKFWRERSRLLGGVARPVLWLLILGSSLRPAISSEALGGDIDYTQYIFPGVVGLTLVFSALQSATSIIWDREFGFLKEVLAAPVRACRSSSARGWAARHNRPFRALSPCCLRR